MRDKFESAYAKIFMDCSGGDCEDNRKVIRELRNVEGYDDGHMNLMWKFVLQVHRGDE